MIARLRHLWARARRTTGVGAGVFLLGLSAAIGQAYTIAEEQDDNAELARRDRQVDQLQGEVDLLSAELACRSRAATEAANIEGQMTSVIGAGLSDLATEDEEGFLQAAAELDRLAGELAPALDRRAEAIEHCQGSG